MYFFKNHYNLILVFFQNFHSHIILKIGKTPSSPESSNNEVTQNDIGGLYDITYNLKEDNENFEKLYKKFQERNNFFPF